MSDKTAAKQRGRPFARGSDVRRGGGKKGRSGPKTLEFKAECARLADEVMLPKLAAKLEEANPDDPAWRWAATTVLEYSKQKAAQQVDLAGAGGVPLTFSLNLGAATISADG